MLLLEQPVCMAHGWHTDYSVFALKSVLLLLQSNILERRWSAAEQRRNLCQEDLSHLAVASFRVQPASDEDVTIVLIYSPLHHHTHKYTHTPPPPLAAPVLYFVMYYNEYVGDIYRCRKGETKPSGALLICKMFKKNTGPNHTDMDLHMSSKWLSQTTNHDE